MHLLPVLLQTELASAGLIHLHEIAVSVRWAVGRQEVRLIPLLGLPGPGVTKSNAGDATVVPAAISAAVNAWGEGGGEAKRTYVFVCLFVCLIV